MTTPLVVLSLGTQESNNSIHDELFPRKECQFFAATSVWDLSAILTSAKVDVAVLHSTLSPGELRSCAAYIRHHWPGAKILLIHTQAELLDDPMYDERIRPDSSTETRFATIERLAALARSGKDRH